MKALVLAVLLVLTACRKSDSSDCASSIGKGVGQLRERRVAMMKARSTNVSPEAKVDFDAQAKLLETLSKQLETKLAARCIEDKWPAEVIDCYEGAMNPDAMRKCRQLLPADQAERIRAEEIALMHAMAPQGSGP